MDEEEILKEFQKIPSVGKAVSEDLYDLRKKYTIVPALSENNISVHY